MHVSLIIYEYMGNMVTNKKYTTNFKIVKALYDLLT